MNSFGKTFRTVAKAAVVFINVARGQVCDPTSFWKSVYRLEGYNVRAFDFDVNAAGDMVVGGDRSDGTTSEAYVYMQNSVDCALKWSYATAKFDQFNFIDFNPAGDKVVASAQTRLLGDSTDPYLENFLITFDLSGKVLAASTSSKGAGNNANIFDGFFSAAGTVYTIGKEADDVGSATYLYDLAQDLTAGNNG